MKKTLTTVSVFIPLMGYSQSSANATGGLLTGLFIIGISVLVFFALRQVMLWYWKVEKVLKNQEEQLKAQHTTNSLLYELNTLLKVKDGKNDI
jgi:hypothetical protein